MPYSKNVSCPLCNAPTKRSYKLGQFCCTAHRDKGVRELKLAQEDRIVLARAQPGDCVLVDGMACRVRRIDRKKQMFESEWVTCCGATAHYPYPAEGPVTCLACIAEN